jgi:hypothetical protein
VLNRTRRPRGFGLAPSAAAAVGGRCLDRALSIGRLEGADLDRGRAKNAADAPLDQLGTLRLGYSLTRQDRTGALLAGEAKPV